MKTEEILEVLGRYKQYLEGRKVPAHTLPDNRRLGVLDLVFYARSLILGHLKGMIPKIEGFIVERGDVGREKVMRWLGFMQGVLWVLGVYTLGELKEHNRSPPLKDQGTSKESA